MNPPLEFHEARESTFISSNLYAQPPPHKNTKVEALKRKPGERSGIQEKVGDVEKEKMAKR